MMSSKIVAVIPARKNSVRLPEKNKKLFCGKPLFAWTVELALRILMINKVIVSSDDPDILEYCLTHYGNHEKLEVIRRPVELAQSTTPLWKVIEHIGNWLTISNDMIVILQPTSPLRNYKDIEKALYMFQRTWEGVIPITRFNEFYYKRCGTVFVDKYYEIMTHKDIREGQFILIPKERAIDIDTLEDFKRAEELMKRIHK